MAAATGVVATAGGGRVAIVKRKVRKEAWW